MKLLLDTHCRLWWFAQPERLNEEAIAHIADETNELWFSVASIWEIGIKVAIGKLPLPEPIDSYISSRMVQLDVRSLEIRLPHRAIALRERHSLPRHFFALLPTEVFRYKAERKIWMRS